jgi:hypothetical protein
LLAIVPAKDAAIVVVANSPSTFVSELGDKLLSALLPGFAPSIFPAAKQTLPAVSSPPTLAGKWSGQIATYKGPVNLVLDIESDGTVRGQIGTQPITAATKLSLDAGHFSARLPGDPAIADAPDHPYWMELRLALHDNDLIGAAISRDGDELPHWARLSRVH